MREIKFRAWDPKEKKMYEMPQYGFEAFISEEGAQRWEVVDLAYESPQCSTVYPYGITKNWHFMQFTGLKDNSGKEIFEGDVVGRKDKPAKEVRFVFGAWHVGQNLLYPVHIDFEDGGKSDWELLGNRYENPNLLQ